MERMEQAMIFIAEIGSNWYVPGVPGLARAKKLIKKAAEHGATAVKFQLFKAGKLYREASKQNSLAHLELPPEWIPALWQECGDNGVEFMCTPFYEDAVGILEPFVKRYKVASWDLTFSPLLKRIGKTNKPVIMSTGAATLEEVETAVLNLRPNESDSCDDITLLHCTGGYPTGIQEMQLDRILDLAAEFFPVQVGLSSHCKSGVITASSVLYGAKVIEVHFDLEDKLGAEAGHSYSPKEFSKMVKLANDFALAKDCGCDTTLVDAVARNMYFRDEEDWLRPILQPGE